MTLDRRIPAVYVDIEDRSLALETVEAGRSGYVVILSDRGPHNKVVELNSPTDLYNIFGEPDIVKHGQAHYCADIYLQYSSRLYAVRPVLLDSDTPENNMSIANCSLNISEIITEISDSYEFVNDQNYITVNDSTSLLNINVGDWIYADDIDHIRQIVDIDDDNLEITFDKKYTGTTGTFSTINKYEKFSIESLSALKNVNTIDTQDSSVLWYFLAIGAGKYYNSIFIRGVRNNELEKMYVDDDGTVLYPNMFMDISIYAKNYDNSISLLEGPFSVSLVDVLPNGQVVKDIFSGIRLYLPIVINRYSKLMKCVESIGSSSLMTLDVEYPYDPDSLNRLAIQSLFAQGNILGFENVGSGGFFLQNGSDGNLYINNKLNFTGNDEYKALVMRAYNGTLTSVDGSIELIVQDIYPWYVFDYVLCGGYDKNIAAAARSLVDRRGDCLLLSDTGKISTSADEDIEARLNDVSWNTWNAALYIQYREITDSHSGKQFNVTPVYHAIAAHLLTDLNYWIAEPVAGMEKGAIQDPIELIYKTNFTKLGDLIDKELNPVIVEPDGIYILTQFSTWKRLSIMKRLHVVKFIHYLKKTIPTSLKDILQHKATSYWINQCNIRLNGIMNKFLETGTSDRYAILKSFTSVVNFDDLRSEINVTLSIVPIRAIERINVNILVY